MSRAKPSHGNVFEDLGVPQPEIARVKAELALRIARLLEARGLTQARAAEALGIDQPKVSNLLRGRLAGFSTDRLLRFLVLLGQDVEIILRDGPAGGAGIHVTRA